MHPTTKVSEFRLSIRHVRFDAEYDHPNSSQLSLGQAQSEAYSKDKGWARIFLCKNEHSSRKEWSANDFLIEYLRLRKITLLDLISPGEIERFRVSGASTDSHFLPVPLDSSVFFTVTDQGPVPLKELKFEVAFTLSKRKFNSKKIEKSSKPFVVFSREADIDYLLARLSSLAGAALHARAGYFSQQACEKYLKAFSVFALGEFAYSHKLLELAEQCAEANPFFGAPETISWLKKFDEFSEVGRYGGAARFDPNAQKGDNFSTFGVLAWFDSYFQGLDALVYVVRDMLNFEGYEGFDTLRAILDGDEKNWVVGGWKLQTSLRDVLTTNNRAFK